MMSGHEQSARSVTAHHEAGHVVASVMRGGSTFRSVDLASADEGHGLTLYNAKAADVPFMAYAGPWAEARHTWPADVPVDDEDHDGLALDDLVHALRPHDDHVEQLQLLGIDVRPYEVWHRELEAVWPAVQTVAARLLAGDVLTDADVREVVEREVVERDRA